MPNFFHSRWVILSVSLLICISAFAPSITEAQTFAAPPSALPALSISGVQVSGVTPSSATVIWTTNLPASSVVSFGTSAGYGQTASNASPVTSHSLTLTGLSSGTLYHYQVSSQDASQRRAVSGDATFTTGAAASTVPVNVSGFFAVPGDASVKLLWSNPAGSFAGVRLIRKAGSPPVSTSDGVLVYNGTGRSYQDTGLVNGTMYYYAAFTYNEAGAFSLGVVTSATPQGPTSPPSPPPSPPPPPPTSPPSGTTPPAPKATSPPVPKPPATSPSPGVTTSPPSPPKTVTSPPGRGTPTTSATGATTTRTRRFSLTSAILDFVRRHDVQDSNRLISVPLAALLILNAFTAASLFDVLAYLRFLLTEPIILLGSKKRKWGVVYDSLTKEPIDLAMIRLESAQNKGIILQTRVTDRSGRFAFFAKPGKYTVSIVKPGFKFPTSYLANKNEDIGLASLYHGQTLSATEKEGVLHPNVPLDPEAREQTPRSVKLKKLSLRLRNVVACTGPVIGFMSFIITPSPLTGVSFAFQVGSLVMFRRIAIMRKPKRWGVIKDAVSSKPLSNVIIRIFDKQFNKLLETQITGLNGAYGFLVKKSTYFFTAEKSGFKKYVSPDIDFKGQDNLLVDQSFKMERTAPEDK